MDYRETIITGSDFTKMGATETKDYVAHVLCWLSRKEMGKFP